MSERIPVVAVLNSNDDIVELLRLVLEQAGFVVISAHVDKMKRGDTSVMELMTRHRPDVILYDIVPPYETSWRFLELLRDGVMKGPQFVLTSTNPKRVAELTGAPTGEILEIIGKPYDLDRIVESVRAASRIGRSD
jgi:DNA-binding response OmpR family regulator